MKNRNFFRQTVVSYSTYLMLLLTIAMFSGCAAQQVAKTPALDIPAYFKGLQPAAQYLATSLSRQLAGKARQDAPQLVVDVFFNEQSAEVTTAGQSLQASMIEYLGKGTPSLHAFPLSGATLQKSQWVVLGNFRLEQQNAAGISGKWIKIISEVKDIVSDSVLAKSEAFVDAHQFSSSSPIKFYKDAPMFMTSDGTTHKKSSNPMNNSNLAQRLAIDAKLADARNAYDAGNYTAAEALFHEVSVQTKGKNIIALSGVYQSQLRVNRRDEAETSFGRLVEAGLDAGSLSVKFLFKVNSTDFLHNDELASQYPLWIRQISLQLSLKNQCMDVNGHASKSGSPEYNERLSRQRAERLVHLLRRAKPALGSRLHAVGKGFSENIVGSGTNDTLDAIDRRVDFDLISCK